MKHYIIDSLDGPRPMSGKNLGQVLAEWMELGYRITDLISIRMRVPHSDGVPGKYDYVSIS